VSFWKKFRILYQGENMNIIKENGKIIGGFPNIEGLMTVINCLFEDCEGVEDLFTIAIRGLATTARKQE
jgi:hypothetical protein